MRTLSTIPLLHLVCLQILLSTNLLVYSQNAYHFRTFSPKGGFYYDGVQSIVQDNDGFIWILLSNDLQRFDGYEYKRYSSYFQNPDMPNFHKIVKDTLGKLYVSTSNGIFCYDRLGDRFEKCAGFFALNLATDGENNLWCISEARELYRLNRRSEDLEKCFHEQKPLSGIKYLSAGKSAMYFASSANKIYRFDYKKQGEVTPFCQIRADYKIAGINCTGEYLWVLTQKQGVLKINISTQTIEGQWPFRDKKDENISINTFYVDKNNRIWIGTQRGLYILDPSTGNYQLYLHSKYDLLGLPNNSVWTIEGDSQQNIWIGTFAGGLCYVNLDEERQFETFTPFESLLSHNLVSSFAEDGNRLWIGTEGGGLNCLNRQTGVFTHYKSGDGDNSLSYNNIKSLALDSRKRLWISMYKGGLDCFDTKTKKFRHFVNDPGNKESLYINDLRKIILAGDSGLWVAYQASRSLISFLSFKYETFTHYSFGEGDSYIFDLQKDNYGNMWLVTDRRLYRMDGKTGIIEDVSSQKMETLNARSICVDAANNVWIGTIGRGLVKYDVSTDRFISYNDLTHFNAYIVNSICPDLSGCLWLGANNGLFRYNITDNTYQRFDESDGLQGSVYYHLASLRGKAGKLYFGGTNGFTIIDAQSIRSNKFEPRTVISDFYIDNISAIPKYRKDFSDREIILNHNQINFGFKFSSDNYLLPNKNQFKYRLRGYDDQWITTDAFNRTVMYSKIPAGVYYFEALAANNDGVWSDIPAVIKIKRNPAPWASWWAYLLYSIAALCVLTIIFYYYDGKRRLKLQLYVDNLDKLKKEELHQSQLRFFTNISHDFRTPLSLIIAALDNLKQEGLKEYYYHILNSNAQRLLNLVNELMDFRTVENGKMQLQVQPADVNRLVTELASDFNDYAKKRHIRFEVVCDPELPDTLYIDKKIMEKVVMNLLNNAFKYTNDGGKIRIETHAGYSQFSPVYLHNYNVPENHILETGFLLVVRDTGVGISEDLIKNVFERYYQVNVGNPNQQMGTGIGLALVKSLVLLHKGSIFVFSEPDKGTDFVVSLPIDASIYTQAEFAGMKKNQEQFANAQSLSGNDNMENLGSMDDILRRDKKRVLVVEDNDDLRRLLSGFLSKHYEVVETANGVEASKILEEADVDLILSDIMMPLKDGVTLCREVKSDINTSHIPFILLTAKTGLESKIEGAGSGADVYFEKPLDFNLLLLSIQNMFRHQQNLREYYAKNYYVDSAELSANEQDNAFLKKLIEIIDANLNQPNIDVSYIASELSMSRSKLYLKIKTLTGKSIVEFILNYRLRKAARLIIEQDMSMLQVMGKIGVRSQSYFTSAFKKEFGETPTAFVAKHRKK
jgi:signal transduction histidine kinase/ligand-binding sensor domain-containing protein/DNA-binding response OmpR family regulator